MQTIDPAVMVGTLSSIALAIAAAAAFAAAAALQHHVVRTAAVATRSHRVSHGWPRGLATVVQVFPRMVRSPAWLLGLLGALVGFGLHASALYAGDLAVVQTILVLQLLFTLPFTKRRTGRTVLARDWLGTVSICLGIAVLTVARAKAVRPDELAGPTVSVVAVGGLLVAVLLTVAWRSQHHGRLRTALMGLAAGVTFSLTATLITLVTVEVARSGLPGLVTWSTLALAVSASVSTVLVQAAYASGSLPAAVTAMTVADPVASWVWGLLFFSTVPLADSKSLVLSYGVPAALLLAGVAALAYSPTMHDPDDPHPTSGSLIAAAKGEHE